MYRPHPIVRPTLAGLAILVVLAGPVPAGLVEDRPPPLVDLHEVAVMTGATIGDGKNRPPPVVGPYEFATRDDLLIAHLLGPLVKGDVADWPILGGLGKQLGDWVEPFTGAQRIADLITEAFPIEGQPALRSLEVEVEHCARVLGIPRPVVHMRNSPFTQAYVVRAFDRDHLVVTSGLLDLYAGRPQELRFIIGHELGHVRCGHIELKAKAFGLIGALQAINLATMPDRYQGVAPTLALGRVYTWCRESEISADRAGLVCCGDPKTAYQAIMRLHHGLDKDSPWIDPEANGFDPQAVIKSFHQWQHQPFVKLLVDLKRHSLMHPFVPERLAALKSWVDSGAYQAIVDRPRASQPDRLIEVVEIQAFELAPQGQTIDPYVIVFDDADQVLRTATAAGVREARWFDFKSTDRGVDQPRPSGDGQPLFCEIWDANYGFDGFVGGFVVYPDGRKVTIDAKGDHVAEYTAKILWDWKEPQSIARSGYGRMTVRFSVRPEVAQVQVFRKVAP